MGNLFKTAILLAALTCLARRRIDVLYAMLRDGTLYQAQPLSPTSPA